MSTKLLYLKFLNQILLAFIVLLFMFHIGTTNERLKNVYFIICYLCVWYCCVQIANWYFDKLFKKPYKITPSPTPESNDDWLSSEAKDYIEQCS
jgi:hypothetical protein